MHCFLGIDVGSLTTKIVAINQKNEVIFARYLRNEGGPLESIQKCFQQLAKEKPGPKMKIRGVGTTGSGRHLAAVTIGADIIKNEITAHATAARHLHPETRTVIDIGGQDSKIIYLKEGVSVGFNMNTVCAAGTGSFLDHQAVRLNVPIEQFGSYALRSQNPVRISGRCGVFAESDLIHKQQMGYPKEDLIAGLCLALARNYVTNIARSKKAEPLVLFQGGVAANQGIKKALETLLEVDLLVPEYFQVMGALGAALLARQQIMQTGNETKYHGTENIASFQCYPQSFLCDHCSNNCEINELYIDGQLVSRWGSRCAKWEDQVQPEPEPELEPDLVAICEQEHKTTTRDVL